MKEMKGVENYLIKCITNRPPRHTLLR